MWWVQHGHLPGVSRSTGRRSCGSTPWRPRCARSACALFPNKYPVKSPDEDDYKKRTRVMRYLWSTARLPLTLEVDNLQVFKWWIDGTFAYTPQHAEPHWRHVVPWQWCSVWGFDTTKIEHKKLHEAELVGVDDCMPQILWTRYFLEAQGYQIQDSVVYQDNQSAMLLANNGRASSSKWTRHMNICYFFVTDHIQARDL